MNQNRNNNRRRGRGSNRGGQGGASQGNRIDSRARGNAPQMLEKYRKMAHDASLNGDRVQTEYYLQFADHYFRVVADSRTQRDEQRPRPDQREGQQQDDDFEDEDDIGEIGRPNGYQTRREREEEPPAPEGEAAVEGERAEVSAGELNPFVRDERPRRGRPRNSRDNGNAASATKDAPEPEPAGFDASVLPPAISRETEEPAPRRTRGRRPPRDEGGDGEAREAVG